MAGSITLPQVVLDLEEEDRKRYEELKAPKAIVVRYGYMKMVAELPYDGEAKPGCGSKLVIRTKRGTEIGEMLTTTCGNGGCGKSVSRKQMLDYIDNSGGKDYPFTNQGRILRVATVEDLNEQNRLDGRKKEMIKVTKAHIAELNLNMKLVDIEILLGGERILFHYVSEIWIDFRELVQKLATEFSTRIEMHQVNARDEARIVADYEKCGQHCCCKQFLKVLKPVSMRSAKVQKATLDPTKISGRCGRLMCCLRYEDETYETLRKKLPNRKSRVMTDDGPGTVIDSQILTQLVLVIVDTAQATAAYPLENIRPLTKEEDPANQRPKLAADARPSANGPAKEGRERDKGEKGPRSDRESERGQERSGDRGPRPAQNRSEPNRPEPRRPEPGRPLADEEVESREGGNSAELDDLPVTLDPEKAQLPHQPVGDGPIGSLKGPETGADEDDSSDIGSGLEAQSDQEAAEQPGIDGPSEQGQTGRRRRRRRRRGPRGSGPGAGAGENPNSGPPSDPSGPA